MAASLPPPAPPPARGSALTRLRWQLTLSHLAAIAFTLVAMTAAIAIIATGWIGAQTDPNREPAQDARLVANTIDDLVARGTSPADLSVILRAIADGSLHVGGGAPFGPPAAQRADRFWPSFRNISSITVVAPDGRVLGSSDPSGAGFAPPERAEWAPLIAAALSGGRDPRGLVALRPGALPAGLGAAPIVDAYDRPIAVVIVAKTRLTPPERLANLWRALGIFVAASAAVLSGAFVFALVAASLVAYLLARRLVARLERLGQAAEAFAAGDLSGRIDEGPADEVGQLARRLNYMADQLATTIAALEAQKQRAEVLLQSKRDLIANVSHELRTPLASIQAHLESLTMRGGLADERGRAEFAIIDREAERLGRLIDDLFTLSTAETGGISLSPSMIALGEIIVDVADGFRSIARLERQVTIVAVSEPDLPLALADRERVIQVLNNLLRNALRYTPEGGLISLRAEAVDGQARVTVEDTGVGIPAEALPHVFERLYRADEARDRASGGAGLGLAIVHELVEAMGGTVGVDSVVGQGSRFYFTLPLAPTAATAPRSTSIAVS